MSLPLYKEPSIKHILAVAAGKGGVGKSSLTVHLAFALKHLGYKVGVLDADVYGPSMRKMLREDQPPVQKGTIFSPALCQGISMISMAHFRKEQEAAVLRAPMVNGILTQFLQNVAWGPLDYLLIDFPPGTGDIQLTIAQRAPLSGAIMVTTPQEVAVIDVRKAMHMFYQVNVPIVGVVENMSYYQPSSAGQPVYLFGQGGGRKLATEAEVPFLGEIPLDPEISRCCDLGLPLSQESETASRFLALAKQTLHSLEALRTTPRIQDLVQLDPHTFQIEWSNLSKTTHRLSDLQKQCPCARCADQPPQVSEDVRATSIRRVGNYALQIQFTSGCSSGLYRLRD